MNPGALLVVMLISAGILTSNPVREPDPAGPAVRAPFAAADTTFELQNGSALWIDSRAGSIDVQPGRAGQATVRTNGRQLTVRRSGGRVHVGPGRYWDDDEVDLAVTVPPGTPLRIQGIESEQIRIRGIGGSVLVETVEGSVEVEGARGEVNVATVEGNVSVTDVIGPVRIQTGEGEVRLTRIEGPVTAAGIDGDIQLRDVRSRQVAVETVDGDMFYEGSLEAGGRYSLSTHDGDITLVVPESAGLTISVTTFAGSLEASFPIRIRGGLGKITEFSLGDGSARVEVESFDGEIRLIRPGERWRDDY